VYNFNNENRRFKACCDLGMWNLVLRQIVIFLYILYETRVLKFTNMKAAQIIFAKN
jgi:hypothetical protein